MARRVRGVFESGRERVCRPVVTAPPQVPRCGPGGRRPGAGDRPGRPAPAGRPRPPAGECPGVREPAARPPTTSGARGTTGRGSRLWDRACRWLAEPGPSQLARVASGTAASCPTVWTPAGREPLLGDPAHSPDRAHREWVQELQFAPERDCQEPVGLGRGAGHLGEELRGGHTHAQRQSDLGLDARRSRAAISTGDPALRCSPDDLQEGLVDRQSLDQGVVSRNTSNTEVLASE